MNGLRSWWLLATLVVHPATVAIAQAPVQRVVVPADSIPYVCSLERATARAGSEVAARVHLREADTDRVQVTWSATAGTVRSTGREVRWNLRDVPLGIDTLTARLSGPNGFRAECHLRLAVLPPDSARGGVTGRSLLLRGRAEAPGYGMYSYVLLAPPRASADSRHSEIVGSYYAVLPDMRELERMLGRPHLAVTYLPVDRPMRLVRADSLLARYDYARAQVLKSGIPELRPGGLYLVAVEKPISSSPRPQGAVVVMDLSSVPPRLLSSFVREFVNQLAQEEPGDESLSRVALRVRTWLAITADGLPEVRSAVGDWIKYFRDTAGK